MDEKTQQFYADNAGKLSEEYRQCVGGVDRYFSTAFEPGSKVLDIGCGCGRDVECLKSAGFNPYGVDPCEEFLEIAKKECPLYMGYACDALPELKTIGDAAFDGVLCSGVLMHIPEEHLFDSAFCIRRVLRPNGRLLISIPSDTQIHPGNHRDKNGRLFTKVTPEQYVVLFERIGFRCIRRWHSPDSLGRPERSWDALLFVLESSDGRRSIDRIESVLNRDRKVASYKLALFRALADIAITSYKTAIWRPDGKVLIPLADISEKWIEYYWPLCESECFVPQIQSERNDGRHHIAFRRLLEQLISQYTNTGGLAVFCIQRKKHRLDPDVQRIYSQLLSKTKATIKDGPVKHAGGAGTETTVFSYDTTRKALVMEPEMWRELAVMGPWIRDATILRWAELCAKFSDEALKPSQVIDLLLVNPIPERDVSDARSVYENLQKKECVWSRKPLHRKFDVDHAIPYAFWRNNDLWNLLPAASEINNGKRDRLPTRELLHYRREAIVGYWTVLHTKHPARFRTEAARLAGDMTGNWQHRLFSSFVEAIEVTALQRGIPRWQPVQKAVELSIHKGPETKVDPGALHEFDEIRECAYKNYLPLIGALAAGERFQGFDISGLEEAEQCSWIEVPEQLAGPHRFVIRIAGDSMEPDLRLGDYVVFEYHRTPRRDSQIVVINVNDFGITSSLETSQAVKRITQDPTHWIFKSTNPQYDDIRIPKDECDYPILGTMVGLVNNPLTTKAP